MENGKNLALRCLIVRVLIGVWWRAGSGFARLRVQEFPALEVSEALPFTPYLTRLQYQAHHVFIGKHGGFHSHGALGVPPVIIHL